MKFRESGMPDEELWGTFFEPLQIIDKMEVDNHIRTLVDIGCGYGTFLLPISKLIPSKVIGIDIEKEMIDICTKKIQDNNISNIYLIQGDISTKETIKDLEKYVGEIDYVTLFNILHCEEPINLLKNTYKILNYNGRIGVIHWKYEDTPRGPSMKIRPDPDKIKDWALSVGFTFEKQVELPPYHFGLIFSKNK